MHELAHVISLGHVESRTSIMNETLTQLTVPSTRFGVGLTVPPMPTVGTPRT
jgi:hypothetical protein